MIVHAYDYTRKAPPKRVHANGMALDTSQIGGWLKSLRTRAKKTQDQVVRESGIGRGVVTSAEQGRLPELANFLALIAFYRAEDELARKIREWNGGTIHTPDGAATVAPDVPITEPDAVRGRVSGER